MRDETRAPIKHKLAHQPYGPGLLHEAAASILVRLRAPVSDLDVTRLYVALDEAQIGSESRLSIADHDIRLTPTEASIDGFKLTTSQTMPGYHPHYEMPRDVTVVERMRRTVESYGDDRVGIPRDDMGFRWIRHGRWGQNPDIFEISIPGLPCRMEITGSFSHFPVPNLPQIPMALQEMRQGGAEIRDQFHRIRTAARAEGLKRIRILGSCGDHGLVFKIQHRTLDDGLKPITATIIPKGEGLREIAAAARRDRRLRDRRGDDRHAALRACPVMLAALADRISPHLLFRMRDGWPAILFFKGGRAHMNEGDLVGDVQLARGIRWSRGTITIARPMPETLVRALTGQPLTDIIQHPWLPADAVIERASSRKTGFALKVRVGMVPMPRRERER